MAEALNSLFKAELVRNKGPWTGINDLEIAVAEYNDWYNHRRLHGGDRIHSASGSRIQLLLKSTRHQNDGTGLTDPPPNPGLDTDVDLLVRSAPGTKTRFRAVTMDEALAACREVKSLRSAHWGTARWHRADRPRTGVGRVSGAALTHAERRLQPYGLDMLTIENSKEQLYRGASDLEHRRVHRRQGDWKLRREGGVVISDNSQVLTDLQTLGAHSAHGADGSKVIDGEQCGGPPSLIVQNLLRCVPASGCIEAGPHDRALRDVTAQLPPAVDKARYPVDSGACVGFSRDHGYDAVSRTPQVLSD